MGHGGALSGNEILERQVFGPGDVIFRIGEPPRVAYLIQAGGVNIVVPHEDKDKIVGTLAPGDLFGEMALVDSQPRSATAVAQGQTTCIVITPTDFMRRLEKSDPFVRAMVRLLTKRLRKMSAT